MIDKCPECGGEIQATVKTYLGGVKILEDGGFTYDTADQADDEASFYCENDHDLTDMLYVPTDRYEGH